MTLVPYVRMSSTDVPNHPREQEEDPVDKNFFTIFRVIQLMLAVAGFVVITWAVYKLVDHFTQG